MLRHHNHSYLFGPDGSIIGKYSKRHLVPSLEEPTLDPGKVHRVFDTAFGKIGIQICRDILYPKVTQSIANMGAKIIFSPAFWWKSTNLFDNSISKYHANDELQAIKYLVPARAIENNVIFVFTNAAGQYKSPNQQFTLLGYTQICEPYMGIKKILRSNNEAIVISTVETDIVDSARAGWKIRGH